MTYPGTQSAYQGPYPGPFPLLTRAEGDALYDHSAALAIETAARIAADDVLTAAAGGAVTIAGNGPNVPALYVPKQAALEFYSQFRARAYAGRFDVPCFGDSTVYGSGGLYSVCERWREKFATVFGLPDAGKGMFAGGEAGIIYDYPGSEINGFVSSNFVGSPDQFDNTQGQYYYDTGATPGKVTVLRFKQSSTRIWYSARGNAGSFTYSVDGGPTVRVDANTYISGVTFANASCKFIYLRGYDPTTTHTVTLTNLGGRPATSPAFSANPGQDAPASGTLTAGTYYYQYTNVFSGGETTPTQTYAVVVGTGGRSVTALCPDIGQTGNNVYRGTSSTGPFEKVAGYTRTGPSAGYFFLTDTGTAVSAGVIPPTVMTSNLNVSQPACYVAMAPMNEHGLVFQKYATSGNTMQQFLNTVAASASAFGLVYDQVDPYSPSSYSVDTSVANAGIVKPAMGFIQLGFNDMTGMGTTDTTVYTNGIRQFAAMCAAAGVVGVVSSGNLPTNPTKWTTYGALVQLALYNAAIANGCIFWDPYSAIEPYTNGAVYNGGNPHLSEVQYKTQADDLYATYLGK